MRCGLPLQILVTLFGNLLLFGRTANSSRMFRHEPAPRILHRRRRPPKPAGSLCRAPAALASGSGQGLRPRARSALTVSGMNHGNLKLHGTKLRGAARCQILRVGGGWKGGLCPFQPARRGRLPGRRAGFPAAARLPGAELAGCRSQRGLRGVLAASQPRAPGPWPSGSVPAAVEARAACCSGLQPPPPPPGRENPTACRGHKCHRKLLNGFPCVSRLLPRRCDANS